VAERIQLGVIGRAHGVRGLVKVTSHTADPADLTAYGPLSDADGKLYALTWKGNGIAEVSRIVDGVKVKVADRTQAERLTNTRLFIDRTALPPAEDDEYYLADLIGLAALDPNGSALGSVAVVHDYGAGASIEIVGNGAPMVIPFTAACVPTVNLAAGHIVVVPPDEILAAPEANGSDEASPAVKSSASVTMPPEAEASRPAPSGAATTTTGTSAARTVQGNAEHAA
jgi:16S rRNA processing protein RimM